MVSEILESQIILTGRTWQFLLTRSFVGVDEFKPDGHESDDDEETIAKAEGEAKDVKKEVDLLAKESTQDLSEIYPQWLCKTVAIYDCLIAFLPHL